MVPKLRFTGFNSPWEKQPLGGIFDVTSGSTPSRDKIEYFIDGDIPWVKTTDLNNSLIMLTQEKVTEIAIRETSSLKKLPKDTVFVAMYGGFNQIGRTGLLIKEATCNQALAAIKPNKEKTVPYFLLLYLNFKVEDWKLVAASSRKDPNITKKDVEKFQFIYPSINEQVEIADFLSSVDEKITQLNKLHQLLCQYKKGMMQKIFSRKLRFKDGNGEEFPEWDFFSAGELFKNSSNRNHNGDLPILAVTQEYGVVNRDSINIDIKSSQASINSYKIIDEGDFVISLRSFQGGIEYSPLLGICSPAYTILKNVKPIVDGFYRLYLKKDSFIEELSKTVVGIRDGKQISYQAFSTLELPYPTLPEQKKISDFFSAIDDKITTKKTELDKLKTWKQGLLQQMFV